MSEDERSIPGGINAVELTAQHSSLGQHIPPTLASASARLNFPPSYVVVGVYRLFTDKALYKPFWDKCKHGFVRGIAVGAAWAFFTFKLQRKLVHLFWMKSPTVLDLSDDTFLGRRIPFDLTTCAYRPLPLSAILTFFLYRNLRIARQRAWDQTVASRGKGPEFWQPYVEEWDSPPVVDEKKWAGLAVAQGWMMSYVVKKVVLIPVKAIPVAGLLVSAWFKSLDTARYLHRPVRHPSSLITHPVYTKRWPYPRGRSASHIVLSSVQRPGHRPTFTISLLHPAPSLTTAPPQYFEAKKMTRRQIAVFIVEHKYHYRAFGFAASLLESIPFLGIIFSVSNRIGAAMWAHDLEKRQHFIAEEKRKKVT
ncbi:hypothetical protein OF83DRAFT_1100720 [Amylostereum chailletii]|nr:hypothetical protein OF83DRAFT_1100720 [Amylostereum chailletii]